MTSGRKHWFGRPLTALVSLAAVALASAYLLAPTHTAFALSVHTSSSVAAAPGQVIIYGKAFDVHGNPMAGVQATVTCGGQPLLTTSSGQDGTFREVAPLAAPSSCRISVPAVTHGPGATERDVDLAPGLAYEVTVRVNPTGKLILLPVRSY